MPTIREVYSEAYKRGKEKGVTALDLRLLLMHDLGYKEQIDVIANFQSEMKNGSLFLSQVEELIEGKPVEYVIHQADFLTHHLFVDENVLIPRGETEELVANITEKITDYYDPRNYLVAADIGTGSGCISIALRDSFSNWILLASDISEKALAVAKTNFQKEGVRVETLLGDALNPYIEKKINLDIIVSNPPYISSREDAQASVRNYEPSSALFLDKEHSVYESIFRDYKGVKKGGLYMAFEISPDLEDYLVELMAKYLEKYHYEFVKDLNGFTRFLFVYLE